MVICVLNKQNVGEQLQLHLLHTNGGKKTPPVVPELPKPIKCRGLKREMMKIREENTKYLSKTW